MKRAALERPRTLNVWRKHHDDHVASIIASGGKGAVTCACDKQPGRFRKGQRWRGCGNARCFMCHGEKLLGIPKYRDLRAGTTRRLRNEDHDLFDS